MVGHGNQVKVPGEDKVVLEDHPLYVEALTNDTIDFPERLTLEMTSYCNLRCRMCPKTAGHVNTAVNKVINQEVLERVVPLFSRIETLHLSGLWGEVFLHTDLYFRILRLAKEAGCEVRTISNGSLMTRDVSEKLVELGLDDLTISVDAATPETYRQIRVGGDFKKLVKQIKRLQKIKKKKGKERPFLHFGFVGMKRNIRELPELVKIAAKLGVQSVILQEMGEYEDTRGESVAFHYRDLGKEVYEEAATLGRELGVDVALFPPDQFDDSSLHINPARGNRDDVIRIPPGYRKDCDVPWKETVVTTEGDVLPCCSASKPMGNILQTPFEEIWVSQPYQSFRRRLLSSDPPLMCKTCTGIGWKREVSLSSYLKMGETDGQLATGWYVYEKNPVWEYGYRWSKKRGVFFIEVPPGDKRSLNLKMRIAGVQKKGKVLANGRVLGSFDLKESRWETVSFELPDEMGIDGVLRVEVIVDNPSREGGDRRSLGVAVAEAFFS